MLRRKSSKKDKAPKAKKEKKPKQKRAKKEKKPKKPKAAREGVVVAKPGFNVYTTLLLISLLSLCLACLVLGLELQRFGN